MSEPWTPPDSTTPPYPRQEPYPPHTYQFPRFDGPPVPTPRPPRRPKPVRPPRPQTVRTAFHLLLVGATTEILSIALSFYEQADIGTWTTRHHPSLDQGRVDAMVHSALIWATVDLSICALLWIGMAFVIRSGRHWARIIGSLLFAIYTIILGGDLFLWGPDFTQGPHPALTIAAISAPWLTGLATLRPLWTKRSNAYFRPSLEPDPS